MKRILLILASLLMLVFAASAGAAKPGVTRANPAGACGELISAQAGGYTSFDQCTTQLMTDVQNFRYPSDFTGQLVSPREMCAQYEQFAGFTYPFAFDEGPEWPFPVLTAQNRTQCAIALYTLHTLARTLGPPPGE